MANRPNIVFLLNDHQAHYRHGWDVGPKIQRPHFNRLASEGVMFGRAYTACPLCGPARRTMLTGLFPHNHREIHNGTDHPYDRDVYLDILAQQGYRNYYYGKWHAGPGTAYDHSSEGLSHPSYNNPYNKPEYLEYLSRRGLPEYEVVIQRSFLNPERRPDVVAGELYHSNGDWCNEHATGIVTTPLDTHEAFYLANLACDRLRALASSEKDTPFSLRVDFWGPHQPYFTTPEFADLYRPEDILEYPSFQDDLENKPEIYKSETNYGISQAGKIIRPNPLPWSEWQKVLQLCYGQISLVDAAGGRILDTLNELKLADNTIVVWAADHGDAIACHGGHFDKKSYMPEEMVRIPLAIRYPGEISAGQVNHSLVSNIDLAPTFLDAAGTEFTNETDGQSLLPLVRGKDVDWRQSLMCETHGHAEDHLGRLVVTDQFKYVGNQNDMDELYDLQNDPYEMSNLVHDSGHQSTLSCMKSELKVWQEKTRDSADVMNG